MRIFRSARKLQTHIGKIKAINKSIGFVPTMGALHDGHLSLISNSRRENDLTVISIFVNPKQFGPQEDFSSYPRPEKKDILLAKKHNVDIIFYPSDKEMYPSGFLTSIDVDKITHVLCGAARPSHFKGVTTIVGKLLNIVSPDILYLGQKDAQQSVVIRKMIDDLNFNVRVKVCPIVRESDGLALSSRNAYLTVKERREAAWIFRALKNAKDMIRRKERNAPKIISLIRTLITRNTSGIIDYVACVDGNTLKPMKRIHGRVLIACAVKFGKTRLIDNIIIKVK